MALQIVIDENLDTQYRGEATYFSYNIHVDLPDQFLAGYIATHIVDAHIQELANAGSDLLHLKLWEDKLSGTWSTDFKVEVWATNWAQDADTGVTAFGNGISQRISQIEWIVLIPAIIDAVVIIIVAVAVVWTIIEIKHIVTYLGPVGGTIAIVAIGAVVLGTAIILFKK
jgi:hypothetical protein